MAQLFLVGDSGPFVADAVGKSPGDFFHGLHGLAGAPSGRRLALEIQGGKSVVPFQPGRSVGPASRRKGGNRDHAADIIPDVEVFQIFREHPVRGVRLHIDPVDPSAL